MSITPPFIRASAIWFKLICRLLSQDWSKNVALFDKIHLVEEFSDGIFAVFYASSF